MQRISEQLLTPGTRVAGTYMGAEYTGTVLNARYHTINHKTILMAIKTDKPVNIFGELRSEVYPYVNAFGKEETSYTGFTGNDVRLI